MMYHQVVGLMLVPRPTLALHTNLAKISLDIHSFKSKPFVPQIG